MKTPILKITFLALFMTQLTTVQAQESAPTKNEKLIWFEAGLGNSQTFHYANLSSSLALNFVLNNGLMFKTRYLNQTEALFYSIHNTRDYDQVENFGIMSGKAFVGRSVTAYAVGGIGKTTGIQRMELAFTSNDDGYSKRYHYKMLHYSQVSIPIEIGLQFKTTKTAGLGFAMYADINKVKPSYGWIFSLGVGKHTPNKLYPKTRKKLVLRPFDVE